MEFSTRLDRCIPLRAERRPAEPPRVLVLFGSVVLFGAERGNLEVLAALKAQGAEVLFLLSDEPWNTMVPPTLNEIGFAWRKVPYIRIGKRLRWRALLWENPSRFIRANIEFLEAIRKFRPTHIHAYSQSQVVNFLWGLICTRLPMVFRAGDEPTLHNRFWQVSWHLTRWRTTKFVANSRFVSRSLSASGVPAKKIAVIYNRPPARRKPQRMALDLPLPANARVFAFLGQIAEHKGPHVLIDAFRDVAPEFPEARLLLAGRISEWEGDAWARALRDATKADLLIGDRVTFLGEIEDVAGFLARCEVLVVPSLFDDPAPNVVMEAKQAGRAVIAFPRGGIPELVDHGVDGLLCGEATRSALAEAMKAYLENPAMVRDHSVAATTASARFGNAQFGASWSEVYASAQSIREARTRP